MNDSNNSTMWVWLVIAAAIVLGVIVWGVMNANPAPPVEEPTPPPMEEPLPPTPEPVPPTPEPTSTATTTP